MANRAHAGTVNACLDGISDAAAENARRRLGNLGEGDDGLPHSFNRRSHDDTRSNEAERFLWLGGAVECNQAGEHTNQQQREDGGKAAPARAAKPQAKGCANSAEKHRERKSHEKANGTVEGEDKNEAAETQKTEHRSPVGG